MGYQSLSSGEIQGMVDRLFVRDWTNRNERKRNQPNRRATVEPAEMGNEELENMVERLTRDGDKRATDSKRTGSMTQQGIVNTYAWKGWN